MRLTLVTIGLATLAFGQSFEAGVKAGVPVSAGTYEVPYARSRGDAHLNRYTLGPTVELNLPLGFAVEADVLYKRLHSSVGFGFNVPSNSKQQTNSWELPLLAKLRFGHRVVTPYVVGGPSFHWIRAERRDQVYSTVVTSTIYNASNNYFQTGVAAGGGVKVRLGKLKLSPEVRYTRWPHDEERFFDPFPLQNQVDVLLGITF